MTDHDELVRRLRESAAWLDIGKPNSARRRDVMLKAADAITTLQASQQTSEQTIRQLLEAAALDEATIAGMRAENEQLRSSVFFGTTTDTRTHDFISGLLDRQEDNA